VAPQGRGVLVREPDSGRVLADRGQHAEAARLQPGEAGADQAHRGHVAVAWEQRFRVVVGETVGQAAEHGV
jgi:hypothetical protein